VWILPSLLAERITSLKAGAIAGGSLTIAELSFKIAQVYWFSSLKIPNISDSVALDWMLSLSIAAISGFLFGVTYRYIIRNDRNFHLQDGAVLAFGIVRGLALVEGSATMSDDLLFLGWLFGKSLIGFAIARFSLDLAIARKSIEPFL
jgi:hypothetical protein